MTANLLPLLGVAPSIGRGISPQEDQAGGGLRGWGVPARAGRERHAFGELTAICRIVAGQQAVLGVPPADDDLFERRMRTGPSGRSGGRRARVRLLIVQAPHVRGQHADILPRIPVDRERAAGATTGARMGHRVQERIRRCIVRLPRRSEYRCSRAK